MADGRREELKLALVMNGGVSLAVWMGGVSNEIFRVVTSQHPVYSMLCDLTCTTPTVDVISGTSAGGVNGAALAMALLYGGDFAQLREVWLDTGSLADLLRSPMRDNPGSLLRGEEYFLPALDKAFRRLAPAATPAFDATRMPLDLKLTTTLLTGRQGRTVDDFGVPVHDVDYRAYFHFEHRLGNDDDFRSRDEVVPKLARAARSTASFPFAFEPSLVGREEGVDHLKDFLNRPLSVPRYVIDGGILDNKPFGGARDAIFRMRPRGAVRRVLVYVNPDPGDGPPGKPGRPDDDPSDPQHKGPSLAKVLSESVLGIPQSQTIADQLQAIEDHNEDVHARRDSVLTIVNSFEAAPLKDLAGKLYPVYRKRRLATTFQQFVYDPLFDAAEQRPDLARGLLALGKHGREQLQQAFVKVPWQDWIGDRWPKSANDASLAPDSWRWGLFPVEFAARLMLEMLRLAQGLLDYAAPPPPAMRVRAEPATPAPSGDWRDGGGSARGDDASTVTRLWQTLRAFTATPAAPGPATWTPEVDAVRRRDDAAATPWQQSLADFSDRAYAIVADIEGLRESERAIWSSNTVALLEVLFDATDPAHPVGGLLDALRARYFPAMFGFLGGAERMAQCASFAYRIAELLREGCPLASEVAVAARASGRLRGHDADRADKLEALADRLGAPADAAGTIYTMLQIEIVEYAFNEHDAMRNDVAIDLMQISGNSCSPLGGKDVAKDKLLGLQLGHFGAFYKRSWRANDWTFGRLDGAERLVRLLLNPDRLYRLYYRRRADAVAQIQAIAVTSVPSAVLRDTLARQWPKLEPAIVEELRFLDDRDERLPDALPCCAAAITARLHYGILREELPVLADAIHADQAAGSNAENAGQAFLDDLGSSPAPGDSSVAPFSPEQARRRLESGLIAGERFAQEAGSDLFTRTLAHAAATTQAALGSTDAKLGPLSLFFASLKLPVLGFYFVANGLTHQSRTSAALNGATLALGMMLVALQFLWSPEQLHEAHLPSLIVTLGWVLFAYGLLMSVARWPRITGAVVAIALGTAAWLVHDYQVGLVIALVILVLLVASYWWAPLQWVAGFATLGLAAMWGSGWLYRQGDPGALPAGQASASDFHTVLILGGVVALALVMAVLQAIHGGQRGDAG